MRSEEYTIMDFLTDEGFQKWAKDPFLETASCWSGWVREHPEKWKDIAIAKEISVRIQYRDTPACSEADQNEVWENIRKGKLSNSAWSCALSITK